MYCRFLWRGCRVCGHHLSVGESWINRKNVLPRTHRRPTSFPSPHRVDPGSRAIGRTMKEVTTKFEEKRRLSRSTGKVNLFERGSRNIRCNVQLFLLNLCNVCFHLKFIQRRERARIYYRLVVNSANRVCGNKVLHRFEK